MAFHYQNIIKEKDFQYAGIEERYKLIKDFANAKLINMRRNKKNIKIKDILEVARINSGKEIRIDISTKISLSKVERILVINNIIFPDDEYFIERVLEDYKVDKKKILDLKEVIDSLNRKDGDFLNGTLEGLVRYHIPQFDLMADDIELGNYNEFLIWKLMEITYLNKNLLDEKRIGQK